MAKEKKQFISNDLDQIILDANAYLAGKAGWEPIQLCYSSHKETHVLAFTAANKGGTKVWHFVKSETFAGIGPGNKDVGVYWVNDEEWFVGVPQS
jgi:hypothetical protein